MKHYTVFYRIGQAIKSIRVIARNAQIAARFVRKFYHGQVVTVE